MNITLGVKRRLLIARRFMMGDDGMSVPCAWCGERVSTGDSVSLFTPLRGLNVVGARWPVDPQYAVSCMRTDCSNGPQDARGYWMPPGQVVIVIEPTEE
ncbi:MAG: hypothetical protein WC763_00730 [Candidatus Paceibacterota bacterium]|jgi:hypothetical protein